MYSVSLKNGTINEKNGTMAKLEWWESNRNVLLYVVTFKTYNNVTNFSNEWTQEVKCAESLLFLVTNESEAKICY